MMDADVVLFAMTARVERIVSMTVDVVVAVAVLVVVEVRKVVLKPETSASVSDMEPTKPTPG